MEKAPTVLERAPKDANIIAHTWKYVNQNGGPDKHVKNNPQFAIAELSKLSLRSAKGLNEVYSFSMPGTGEALFDAR